MLALRSPCVLALLLCLSFVGGAEAQPTLLGIAGNAPSMPNSRLVNVDTVTGAATISRDTGIFLVGGIAANPSSGELFGMTTVVSSPANALVKFDQSTGSPMLVGSTGLSQIVEGDLCFAPDGRLFGMADLANIGARRLFTIDLANGGATVVGNIPSSGDLSAMAFRADGTLFMIDTNGGVPSLLLTVNSSNGAITSSTALSVDLGGTAGMAFDPVSGLLYVADGSTGGTNALYIVDPASGIASVIGALGVPGGIAGLTFTAVPEPSGLILLGTAIWFGRRFTKVRNSA